jgi:hypothetical protein
MPLDDQDATDRPAAPTTRADQLAYFARYTREAGPRWLLLVATLALPVVIMFFSADSSARQLSIVLAPTIGTMCLLMFLCGACNVAAHVTRRLHRDAEVSEPSEEKLAEMATVDALQALPTRTWSTEEGDDNDVECALCLEALADGDNVRPLPCVHVFHTRCIDRWFMSSASQSPHSRRAEWVKGKGGGQGDGTADAHPQSRNAQGRPLFHAGTMRSRRRSCPFCKADPLQDPSKPSTNAEPPTAAALPGTQAGPHAPSSADAAAGAGCESPGSAAACADGERPAAVVVVFEVGAAALAGGPAVKVTIGGTERGPDAV